MNDAPSGLRAWDNAVMAATLLAVDPAGLGGVVMRSAAGEVREAWTAALRDMLPAEAPMRRCPLHIGDERLLGGLDLAASLGAGRAVAQRGLLAEAAGGVVLLPSAERVLPSTAARIVQAMDAVTAAEGFAVVAFDEGDGAQEASPAVLKERCAFHCDLHGVRVYDIVPAELDRAQLAAARARLVRVRPLDDALLEGVCAAAHAFGVQSARASLLTVRAACASAALAGRCDVNLDDVMLAARLVLAPRATMAPDTQEEGRDETPEQAPADAEPPADAGEDGLENVASAAPPTDVVIAAVQAVLPAEALARLRAQTHDRATRASGGGGGADAKSAKRGRPLGSRSGALRAGERLNIVDTLRAAAPWQKLRGASAGRVAVRRGDFRIRRFVERREATTVFVVDASGSAAFQRLAEAKGAIELLLADAYVTRARVALVAFRHVSADVLLAPTRSLARARRQLADLPGGGGTPLAHGLETALMVALAEKAKGRTPRLLLLTDGRANITRDGGPGRARAEEDALKAARLVRAAQIAAVHVDTSPRPRPDAAKLAEAMGATYAALPYLDAHAVRALVPPQPQR